MITTLNIKRQLKNIIVTLLIALGTFFILLPIAWMVSTSLKAEHNFAAFPPEWVPKEPSSVEIQGENLFLYDVMVDGDILILAAKKLDPVRSIFIDPENPDRVFYLPANVATKHLVVKIHWENYINVWNSPSIPFRLYMFNTLIYASVASLAEVLSSSFIAFGFARVKAPGKNLLFMVVLATMMIPPEIMNIPLYILFTKHIPKILNSAMNINIALSDSWWPLYFQKFFGDGFLIYLMRQFYMGIPKDYDDAARIDGCGYFKVWWMIILPMSKPVLIAAAIISFQYHWAQDYMMPMLYLNTNAKLPLTVGLANFQSAYGGTPWHLMMAASIISVVPLVLIFFVMNRYFIQGVVIGGIKE